MRVVQGCTMAVAQSRRKDAPTPTTAIRQPRPATLSPAQQVGYYFWCGGCENTQLAGKARMPYKMNAQSFKHGCLKSAALSCHTMWQPKRLTRHGCETNKAFINVQRMHDSGRTESLHDAATQTTAIRHPATLPLPQTGIALLFLVLGGEFALCG